jgi:SAM-dependent methyltransferase
LEEKSFYNKIASFYDDMTRFTERLDTEQHILQQWVDSYQISSAVDVACGTGLHAIALARLGVVTTGADVSENMLTTARAHAKNHNVHINWVQQPMQSVELDQTFDAVFCLGNSLPHLKDPNELDQTLGHFKKLLNPAGIIVIQLLNYDRVLANKHRLVGMNKKDDTRYIRFYDFEESYIRFNVLAIKESDDQSSTNWQSTRLYPFTKDQLLTSVLKIGLQADVYADLDPNPYEDDSKNLVLVASQTQK